MSSRSRENRDENGYIWETSYLSSMKNVARYLLLFLVAALLLAAGCTQPAPTPQVTPTPTPLPTDTTAIPATTAPAGMGTPGPTQTLPPQYSVMFQITPNGRTTDPLTFVGVMGGNGMNFITEIEIILTEPSGTQHIEYMRQPLTMGQNVGIPCSTFQNRVEIWTTAPTVGKIKVYDDIVPFQSVNP
jgi:hypothetical protein